MSRSIGVIRPRSPSTSVRVLKRQLDGAAPVVHHSLVSSGEGVDDHRSAQRAPTALFVAVAVMCVPAVVFGVAAWGLLGFGVEAASLFVGAALFLGLGVVGARRAVRGERPWSLLLVAAAVGAVLVIVHIARH